MFAEDALNGLGRDLHMVDPLEPDPRPARAELVREPRLRDQRHDILADSSRTQASSAEVTCRESNPCWSPTRGRRRGSV